MKKCFLGFFIPLIFLGFLEMTLRYNEETKIQKAQKIQGIPAMGAQLLLASVDNINFVPLGGVSHQKTVLCKESSDWAIYQSDRFGFPNPDSVWNEKSIDLAFIGDSYFQGGCLKEEDQMINYFRKENSVLNLSSFGHGPLAQLGIVMEYLDKHRPKKLVLSYVPNDLNIDLALEMNSSTMLNYLKGEKQNLMSKQKKIDQLFLNFKKKTLHKLRINNELRVQKYFHQKMLDHKRIEPQSSGYLPDYEVTESLPLEKYRTIIGKIQSLVQSWGGEFFIVFIPDANFFSQKNRDQKDLFLLKIQKIIQETGITFIDLSLMFEKKNPFEFYAPISNYYGHFNKTGAKLAYEYIKKMID